MSSLKCLGVNVTFLDSTHLQCALNFVYFKENLRIIWKWILVKESGNTLQNFVDSTQILI